MHSYLKCGVHHGRSNKIKNELIICSAKVIKSIKKVLDESIENGHLKIRYQKYRGNVKEYFWLCLMGLPLKC